MVLDKLHAGVEVCLVELIGDVPTERTKLATLLQHGGETERAREKERESESVSHTRIQ